MEAADAARAAVAATLTDYRRSVDQYHRRTEKRSTVPSPPTWSAELAPVMDLEHYNRHVLKSLPVSMATGRWTSKEARIGPARRTGALLNAIMQFMHDSGGVFWFSAGALADTVIVAPDTFCSAVVGALFQPKLGGYRVAPVDGVHTSAVPFGQIATALRAQCGIGRDETAKALQVLERLGLCHRTASDEVDGPDDVYLFPGAVAAGSARPGSVMLRPSVRHYAVGRQFVLAADARNTTIFRPGMVPELQSWVLGRYGKAIIWESGLHVPFGATDGTPWAGAEAAVQLHCHGGSREVDAARGGDPGDHMIVVVVRSRTDAAGSDAACRGFFDELCREVRRITRLDAACLTELGLPPTELAKSCRAIDLTDQGFPLTHDDDTVDGRVWLWGVPHDVAALMHGDFADVHVVQDVSFPVTWVLQCDDGGDRSKPRWWRDGRGLAVVQEHSDEWRAVAALLHASMPDAVLVGLERWEDRMMWFNYAQACKRIKLKRGEGDVERQLWHGTGKLAPKDALLHERGLDPRFSSKGFYGRGLYLAERARYSSYDTYAHMPDRGSHPNRRQLIVVRAAVGRARDFGSTVNDATQALAQPPEELSGTRYDSVRGGPHHPFYRAGHPFYKKGPDDSAMYVLYEPGQAYPEYVVTFDTRV
mmetsp:Transcript_8486/g.21756  ORF Transcript_8486/g.21756 Transcript_8486/m.21756 type:complete len:648 (+) Transcript_8486:1687-3630(+)